MFVFFSISYLCRYLYADACAFTELTCNRKRLNEKGSRRYINLSLHKGPHRCVHIRMADGMYHIPSEIVQDYKTNSSGTYPTFFSEISRKKIIYREIFINLRIGQ